MASLVGGEIELSSDLSPDSASIHGALQSEQFTEADLAAGLWDGARVDVFAVDWRDPSTLVALFSGTIGEVSRGAHAFEAELRGLQAALNAAVGRTIAQRCDAALGDRRCSLALAPFSVSATVASVVNDRALTISGLASFSDGWFTHGEVRFGSTTSRSIRVHHAPGTLALEEVLPPGVTVGSTVTVIAGCDKTLSTCRSKFANQINFQGFPHMPGNDLLAAGLTANEPRDGGSRFR
jgi:uncharacterized phage protein (TIGR02218 family)